MDTFQHLVLPSLSVLFFIAFILRKWQNAPRKGLPPSPKGLPIIGNLHQIGKFPHRSLQVLSRRYGTLMLLRFGRVPVVVVSSSDAAREIMKNQDLIFCNRPKQSIADRLCYGSRDVAFAPYGEYWRQVRRICVLHLFSTKRVQSFRPVREEETSNMVEKVRQLASSSTIVNLRDLFSSLTNDVVCRVALGRKYENDVEGRRLKKLLGDFVYFLGAPSIGELIPWLGWISRINGTDDKVGKVAKLFDEFLVDVLEEHRQKKEQDKCTLKDGRSQDFVDTLLELQKENIEASPVEDDTIKSIILDMFAAGTDTTASLLEWTMVELLRNPRALTKLQNEVRKASNGKEDITEDDIENMPYLKAVIKETLRLHSPLPLLVPRESTKDTEVMGYKIPAGMRVIINAWAIGRDPTLWDNSDDFRPERFLDTSTDFRGLHFELIPFGAGRRGCPGTEFAVAVDELALAKLVWRFNFSLPNGGKGMDLDMSETIGITVHRKLPLLVDVAPHAFDDIIN